jgi:hypothetical protein
MKSGCNAARSILDITFPDRCVSEYGVRFARRNIQIYDAHVVDLYQWISARYLIGVKGAETWPKRS